MKGQIIFFKSCYSFGAVLGLNDALVDVAGCHYYYPLPNRFCQAFLYQNFSKVQFLLNFWIKISLR